jgi:hypothetical protein
LAHLIRGTIKESRSWHLHHFVYKTLINHRWEGHPAAIFLVIGMRGLVPYSAHRAIRP